MNDRPPVVDFSTPYSAFQDLAGQRERVREAAEDIRKAMADLNRFDADSAHYATIAAAWAATLMVADILKIGLSAGDRRAKLLFDAQDKAIERADKVLKFLGLGSIETKADLMKSLDQNLQSTAKMADDIRKSRAFLKEKGLKASKEVNLVLDLATAMTEDTLLLLQAQQAQQRAFSQSAGARSQMRSQLARLRNRMLLIDEQLTQQFERAEKAGRTA